jgi:hypothetical protein
MARHKNVDWNLTGPNPATWQEVEIAVLEDIRDELQRINGVLNCSNFLDLPRQVRLIQLNTKRRKKKPAPKK